MKKYNINFIILLFLFVFITSGCSISFNTGSSSGVNDGGVYVTKNKGETWQQKVLIPTNSGRAKTIATLNTNALVMDPGDNKALYFGSIDNGLFYTYDSGDNWVVALGLNQSTIASLAVDPDSRCIIYAAIDNKVYKSTDCNRSWAQIYFDNSAETKINSIAIDHFKSTNVYIGTSRGEIIKSLDRGVSWQTIKRFENSVAKIVISPSDSRMLFAATAKEGLFISKDAGAGWQSLSEQLKDFKDILKFRDFVCAVDKPGQIFLATDYGLLASKDYGENWSKIELITPENKATINAIAVSPKDSKEIYYVTNTTFYRSLDGGENWTTKKLPTSRSGWKLLIDPKDTGVIYLGARKN